MRNNSAQKIISILLSAMLLISGIALSPFGAYAYNESTELLSEISTENWMSVIRDDTKLTEITIPGTHDSCARKFANEDVFGVMSGISKCQDLNITEQLNAGIRFLDIRCEADGSSFSVKTVHGSTDCWNGDDYYYLDYVLQDVYNWLDSHSSETVLVSIKEDDGNVGAPNFTSAVYQYIHGYGQNKYFYGENYNYNDYWYLGKSVPALVDVRGKCVLMNRFDQYIESSGSEASENESGQKVKWGDQSGKDYSTPVYTNYYNNNTGVGNFHVQDHYEWSASNKVSATQDMLSLGHYHGEYYINFSSTTEGESIPNPKNSSKSVNPSYYSFNYNKSKPSGIFAIDFATSDLARKIIENNEGVCTLVNGSDGNISYSLNRKTGVLTISGNGSMNNYAFSSSSGASAMGSTAPWGDQNTNALFEGQYNSDLITSIVIEEGVSSIGNYAFYGYDHLTSVSLPSSLKSIGEGAFARCSALTSLDISDKNISSIGAYAFKDCTSLNTFITADCVSEIGSGAFQNDSALTMYGNANIPSQTWANENSVNYIAQGAYNADTDWFTSKAKYYEPFNDSIGGTPYTNTAGADGSSVSYTASFGSRQGVAFLPWSIDRTGSNYIDTSAVPFGSCSLEGATISFFRQIGGNYYDGAALTLSDGTNSFAIYDNGKFYFNSSSHGFSYETEAPDNRNKVWQMFTLVITNSAVKLYINGNLNTNYQTDTSALLDFLEAESTKLYLGSYISRGTCSLYLDEVSAFDFAVSADESKAMYLSYESPEIYENDVCAADADIKILSSDSRENVIYTHGENTETVSGLYMAADYMFCGDEIADGDNDDAYIVSTDSPATENELYTTLSINGKYSINSVTDNYSNAYNLSLISESGGRKTYKLSGSLSSGYTDGEDDNISLSIKISDGNNEYTQTKYVFVTTHPVSSHAASAVYKTWTSGTSTKYRDTAVLFRADGSTGVSSTYYSGNYVFVHTPVYIGNGWGFASNTNADNYLMMGDGKQGDNSSSAFPTVTSKNITNAGCYAQSNTSDNGEATTVLAAGTSANYYIDKSTLKANGKQGGVSLAGDGNTFSVNTVITRLAARHVGDSYQWSGCSVNGSNNISFSLNTVDNTTAESIGSQSNNDNGGSEVFAYTSPTVEGSLSNGNEQSAEITVGINHSTTNTYLAKSQINFNFRIYDKSTLRNLVNSYENEGLTGKGYAKDVWKNYQSALSNAYKVLNNYKNTSSPDENSEVYRNLVNAHSAFDIDTAAYNSACEYVKNTLSADKLYKSSTLESLALLSTENLYDQTSYDIITGKLRFEMRFLEELSKGSSFEDIENTVSENSDAVKYDQSKIQSIVNGFYSSISKTVNLAGENLSYYCYYSQDSYNTLYERTVNDINEAIMNYSITAEGGSSLIESENPFKNKDLSNGVTISFDKYSASDNGWNTTLLSFSSGNRNDNRYFLIMGNGTVLFNDGNGGTGGYNGCYFDINSNENTNSTSSKWVNIKLSIYKSADSSHILDYYIDNDLVQSFNLSEICAWGYSSGVSGNDGIFSFLQSEDINLYYGASFSIYKTMAGTVNSYLDNVRFYSKALTPLEISSADSSLLYTNSFDSELGGEAVTNSPDNGNYVSLSSEHYSRQGCAYIPFSRSGSVNYINTNANPFADTDLNGFTVSFYQRINGNYWDNAESITFAQGDTAECKYFTIGTDGYIRFNNGNGGTDSNLTSAGLYFDYTENNTDIVKQKWQLITVSVVDDYHINIYVDGAISKTITIDGSKATSQYLASGGLLNFIKNSSSVMYFGSYTPYWGTATLSLDNVRCFDKALSPSQAAALYRYENGVLPQCEFENEFTSSVPERISGSAQWEESFENKNGVLHIPTESADGDVSIYVNGVQTYNTSSIPYGSNISIVYNGTGSVTEWKNRISNSLGTSTVTYDDYTCDFVLEGNSTVTYLASQEWLCRHKETEIRNALSPSCTAAGYTGDTYCSVCGELLESGVSIPKTEHTYTSSVIEATPESRGYTLYTCSVCGDTYQENFTPYASDKSVLVAATEKAQNFSSTDYTPESYQRLTEALSTYSPLAQSDIAQSEVDFAAGEIISAINLLRPYLYITAKGENASVTLNSEASDGEKTSVVFGDAVTLVATPDSSYKFYAWYETVSQRIFSTEQSFTYTVTSNTDFKAICIKENASVLTFANDSGQIVKYIAKNPEEWQSADISSLLPAVPFKYGYTNGRWNYNEEQIISSLVSGSDTTIIPVYDETSDTSQNAPQSESINLTLSFTYNEDEQIGSFVLNALIPENCEVESIGTVLYYKNADEFNPSDFDVNITNKTVTSKFEEKVSGTYVTDIVRFSSKCNWAVKGYVTYYDEDNNLVVAYSNQVNVVDKTLVE